MQHANKTQTKSNDGLSMVWLAMQQIGLKQSSKRFIQPIQLKQNLVLKQKRN